MTYNLKLLLIVAIFLALPFGTLAQHQRTKMPLGDFKVRNLKRRQKHIQTAALLCALHANGGSYSQIKEVWRDKLEVPISVDDEFLVNHIMGDMCPDIELQNAN